MRNTFGLFHQGSFFLSPSIISQLGFLIYAKRVSEGTNM